MVKRATHWRQLLTGRDTYRGEGSFPIAAYSEYMPAPRIGQKPYDTWSTGTLSQGKPRDWLVTEHEEMDFLRPGLAHAGAQLVGCLAAVAQGGAGHHIGAAHLKDNPYWPQNLAEGARALPHERFLVLSPLALSRTQDDKGRVRWTVFGGSHDGPSRGFWRSFYDAEGLELPAARGRAKLAALLKAVFGVTGTTPASMLKGLRVLPDIKDAGFATWSTVQPPTWLAELKLDDRADLTGVTHLLTFRPFAKLPKRVQEAYLGGRLFLLPYPGSLVFWGSPHYRAMDKALPGAIQIPLLQNLARHSGVDGLRVPQSGWMFLPGRSAKGARGHDEHLGPLKSTYHRSHRWDRVERDDDTQVAMRVQGIERVLFSAHPDDVSLYDKPMARNAQVWSDMFEPLLDGPSADGAAIKAMLKRLEGGGSFGYRMYFPPMVLGQTPVFWHRPLVAYRDLDTGAVKIFSAGFTGYLSADGRFDFAPAIEVPARPDPPPPQGHPEAFVARAHAELNVRKLSDARARLGLAKLPLSFARALLTCEKHARFDDWLSAALKANEASPRLAANLDKLANVTIPDRLSVDQALTYSRTATRDFEVAYWTTIAQLSAGAYLTKNNADVVDDAVTRKLRKQRNRDLDPLGDYLIAYYRKLIAEAGMAGEALAGEHRFQWRTDFDFAWMGGWNANRQGDPAERNIICVISGRNRGEAVILGDHYDTAYMEDIYGYGEYKGNQARVAAAGADDNNSATATLMLAAPIFLEMSKRGQLDCDIWLVHLTGEEFPSDCLGARNLSQSLIEGSLRLGLGDGTHADLSATKVRGVYVMDMIAHNNDRNRNIFQFAPGTDPQSMWLAYQGQRAAQLWALGTAAWNEMAPRKKAKAGVRSADPAVVPSLARHLAPLGEVRPHFDPRSTLFNTDGQVFSDAGIPVVLVMENYDIERQGYHDTHDTMENIDLDYGAAVAAICIEATARAASNPQPDFEAIRLKAMR